jgi:hypothetical protein
MVEESIELIKLCQIAPNVNHKQELSLDVKCHESHTVYIFKRINIVKCV